MEFCLITFRSVTPAQRGESLLKRQGITCSLQRTPRVLADKGCGYSLRLRRLDLDRSLELLRQRGIAFRKAYCMTSDGSPEEISL